MVYDVTKFIFRTFHWYSSGYIDVSKPSILRVKDGLTRLSLKDKKAVQITTMATDEVLKNYIWPSEIPQIAPLIITYHGPRPLVLLAPPF